MEKINRKKFLKNAVALSFTGLGAVTFLAGCGKKNEPGQVKKESGPCSDLSGLTESEKKTRTLYRYVANSPHEDKKCHICHFYISPKGGSKCGTCQIVKGPINPDGYCTSFVKKTQS